MIHLDHAILHAFDFDSGSAYPSDRELDLGTRAVKSYVQRNMHKLVSSPESRHGEFDDQSSFGGALRDYAAGGPMGFVELSQLLASFFWEELRLCEDLDQCDLLVADFTDTRDMRDRAQAAGEGQMAQAMAAAAAQAADEEGLSERFFACALLPRRQAYVHDLGADGTGAAANEILRQDATLPNPSQKLDTYLLVNLQTGAVDFHDRPRSQAGTTIDLVSDRLLHCAARASAKEAVQSVEEIVEQVAQEYGANAASAVAQAKHAVTSAAQMDESFSPLEVGRQVFEDRPEMWERYEEVAREERLPDEVPVRRSAANRIAKNHRIRTDTGIEISFPSEYAADDNYIEFSADAQGMVSILIKNVAKIENR